MMFWKAFFHFLCRKFLFFSNVKFRGYPVYRDMFSCVKVYNNIVCRIYAQLYTAEYFKWNNKFFTILFYDMKQKGDDYKLTAVNYYVNNDDTMDNTCKIFNCKKPSLHR